MKNTNINKALKNSSKKILRLSIPLLALYSLAPQAMAEDFPKGPVTIVVPYSPGGAVGNFGQMLANGLSEEWGVPVIAENRPGAAGNIGTEAVVQAAPDGYTILLATETSFVTNKLIFENLSFDPVSDLDPVSHLANIHSTLVVSDRVSANNFEEFVTLMQNEGGRYNYGSTGVGDANHLDMISLISEIDAEEPVHIPYQGMANAVQGVLTGDHDMLFVSPRTIQQHIDSGAVKALAMSGETRAPSLPDVPTMAELNMPTMIFGFYLGAAVPNGTPEDVVDIISNGMKTVLSKPDMIALYEDRLGYELIGSTPQEFEEFLLKDMEASRSQIESSGISIQ